MSPMNIERSQTTEQEAKLEKKLLEETRAKPEARSPEASTSTTSILEQEDKEALTTETTHAFDSSQEALDEATLRLLQSKTGLSKTLNSLKKNLKAQSISEETSLTLCVLLKECLSSQTQDKKAESYARLAANVDVLIESGFSPDHSPIEALQQVLEIGRSFSTHSFDPKETQKLFFDLESYVLSTLEYDIKADVSKEQKEDFYLSALLLSHKKDESLHSFKEEIRQVLRLFNYSPIAIKILQKETTSQDFSRLLVAKRELNAELTKENAQKFAKALDLICMPHQQIRNKVLAAKLSALEGADEGLKNEIELLHNYRANCFDIMQYLPKGHAQRKNFMVVSYFDLLQIIKNYSDPDCKKIPDILLCATYLSCAQEALQENTARALSHEKLLKKLPEQWKNDIAPLCDYFSQGITSSEQVHKAEQILGATALGRRARKSLAKKITEYRSDGASQLAEEHMRAIAGRLLGTKATAYKSVDEILPLLHEKLGLQIQNVDEVAQSLHVFHTSKDTQETRLQLTFAEMTRAQGATSWLYNDSLAPKKTRGETLAYTTLYLQRLLSKSVTDLSDSDLAFIGASREEVSTNEELINFVENTWENTGQADWATGLMLASYIKAKAGEPSAIEFNRLQLEAIAMIEDQSSMTPSFTGTFLENLEIIQRDLKVRLCEGRSRRALHAKSDVPGQILKDLIKQYIVCTRKEGVDADSTNYIVDIDGFRLSTHSRDPEALRKGILAILNGSRLDVSDYWHHDYLCPVDTAHAAMMYCHDTELDSDKRLEEIASRALGKGVVRDQILFKIGHDFVHTVGAEDKRQDRLSEGIKSIVKPLLKNSLFNQYLLPLALLEAQRKCNIADLESFFSDAKLDPKDRHLALINAFKTFGAKHMDAAVLAEGAQYFYDSLHPFVVSMLSATTSKSLSVYSLYTRFKRFLSIETEERIDALKHYVANDVTTILQDLPNNTSFTFSHTAKASAPISAGIASANISLAKQDGLSLWRNEKGVACLSISETYMQTNAAKGRFGLLTLGAEFGVDGEQGLVLEFEDDAACAEFVSLFITDTAKKADLQLSSRVSFGKGIAIREKLSATAAKKLDIVGMLSGKEPGDESGLAIGIGPLSMNAGLELSGAIAYNRSVKNRHFITQTSASFKRKISGSASEKIQSDVLSLVETDMQITAQAKTAVPGGKKAPQTDMGFPGGLSNTLSVQKVTTSGVSASWQSEFAVQQKSTIIRSLDRKTLLRARYSSSRSFASKTSIDDIREYLSFVGITDKEMIEKICESVQSLNGKGFSLELVHRMKEGVLAALMNEEKQSRVKAAMDTAENYYFEKAFIRVGSQETFSSLQSPVLPIFTREKRGRKETTSTVS